VSHSKQQQQLLRLKTTVCAAESCWQSVDVGMLMRAVR